MLAWSRLWAAEKICAFGRATGPAIDASNSIAISDVLPPFLQGDDDPPAQGDDDPADRRVAVVDRQYDLTLPRQQLDGLADQAAVDAQVLLDERQDLLAVGHVTASIRRAARRPRLLLVLLAAVTVHVGLNR